MLGLLQQVVGGRDVELVELVTHQLLQCRLVLQVVLHHQLQKRLLPHPCGGADSDGVGEVRLPLKPRAV